MQKLSVLLTTEATYPYYSGGVSTWCHELIGSLENVEYSLVSIVDSPLAVKKYMLPPNVKEFISIPLWGTIEPSEHLDWVPFSRIFLSKLKTGPEVIEKEFIPVFSEIVDEVLRIEKTPCNFAENLLKMYRFFRKYDYNITLKSEAIYKLYKQKIMGGIGNILYFFYKDEFIPTIHEVGESLGWLFRFFNITNTNVPKTDISHSSAAGFCGVANVISKLLYKTPYLLTEHGVYLREQYLSTHRREMTLFLRNFLLSLTESVVRLNYEFADLVCPVCHFNAVWEGRFGVRNDKIMVIYNGVDPTAFKAKGAEEDKNKIIAVARIDPLKDIENFIQAAHIVQKNLPQISFEVYGAVSNQDYYRKCLKLRDSLGLKEKFKFCGYVSETAKVYHYGDIVVLPSISEAFPYSVVEAMMCGKPVIATDVGGVSEAVGTCGVIVSPKNHEELARECIRLMGNKDLRKELGVTARKRAKKLFTIEKFAKAYLEAYENLNTGYWTWERFI